MQCRGGMGHQESHCGFHTCLCISLCLVRQLSHPRGKASPSVHLTVTQSLRVIAVSEMSVLEPQVSLLGWSPDSSHGGALVQEKPDSAGVLCYRIICHVRGKTKMKKTNSAGNIWSPCIAASAVYFRKSCRGVNWMHL